MQTVTLEILSGRKWHLVTGTALSIGGDMFRMRVRIPGRKTLSSIDWIKGREAEWNVRNVVFA